MTEQVKRTKRARANSEFTSGQDDRRTAVSVRSEKRRNSYITASKKISATSVSQ